MVNINLKQKIPHNLLEKSNIFIEPWHHIQAAISFRNKTNNRSKLLLEEI